MIRVCYAFHLCSDTQDRRQSKTPMLSRNVDQKSIETMFSIAYCHPTGDKWQSKTLFISIFDPLRSFVDNVFDCHLLGVGEYYKNFSGLHPLCV